MYNKAIINKGIRRVLLSAAILFGLCSQLSAQVPVRWSAFSEDIVPMETYPYGIKKISELPEWMGARGADGLSDGETGELYYQIEEESMGKAFGFTSTRDGMSMEDLTFGVYLKDGEELVHVTEGENQTIMDSYSPEDVLSVVKHYDTLKIYYNGEEFQEFRRVIEDPDVVLRPLALLHTPYETFKDVLALFPRDDFHYVNWDSRYSEQVSETSPGVLEKTEEGELGWCSGAESSNLSYPRDDNEDGSLDADTIRFKVISGEDDEDEKMLGFSSDHGTCYGSLAYGVYLSRERELIMQYYEEQIEIGEYSVNDEIMLVLDRAELNFRVFKNGEELESLTMNENDKNELFFIDVLLHNPGAQLAYPTSSFSGSGQFPYARLKRYPDGTYFSVNEGNIFYGDGDVKFIYERDYHSDTSLTYNLYNNQGDLVACYPKSNKPGIIAAPEKKLKKGTNKIKISVNKLSLDYDKIYVLEVITSQGDRRYLRLKNKVHLLMQGGS